MLLKRAIAVKRAAIRIETKRLVHCLGTLRWSSSNKVYIGLENWTWHAISADVAFLRRLCARIANKWSKDCDAK